MTAVNKYYFGKEKSTRKLYLPIPLFLVPLQESTDKIQSPPDYTIQSIILVLSLIVLLAYLFYLVFIWWQRAESSSYLGKIFNESVFESELSRLTKRVDDRMNRGDFHRFIRSSTTWKEKKEPVATELPDSLKKYLAAPLGGTRLSSAGSSYNLRPGSGNFFKNDPWDDEELGLPPIEQIGDKDKDEYKKYKDAVYQYKIDTRNYNQAFRSAVEAKYQEELIRARDDADAQAKKAANIDMGVFRGRGATFVLEFTAVVVIIFTSSILAILGKLSSEQVGTLLAAIAGYVLGRAVHPATGKTVSDSNPANSNENTNGNGNNSKNGTEENKT